MNQVGSFVVRLLAVAALASASACSTNDATAVVSRDASFEAHAPPSDTGYGASECGQCVARQCSFERAACTAEPTCAAYLECLERCPVAGGDADTTCAAACPAPTGSAAEGAKTDLARCRAAVAGAACPACATSVGDGGSRDPLLNQICSPSSDPNVCHQCEDERCCMSQQRCRDNPDCNPYLDCYLACVGDGGNPNCSQTCADSHDAGVRDFVSRIACVTARCGEPCGPLSPCLRCFLRECRDAYVGCQESPDCYLLQQCFVACRNAPTCIDACYARFPAARTAFAAQDLCGTTRCPVECN